MLDKKLLTKCGAIPMEELVNGSKLFIKSGITIISSLAGIGKTTYCLSLKDYLEKHNYNVVYFNADSAPIDNIDIYEPLIFNDLIKFCDTATENDVIIIDSLKSYSSINDLDIMDNKDMMKLMLNLRLITTKTKCSFVLVHHSFKEKKLKTAQEHLFGSRAIEEQVDSAFLFGNDKCTIVKNRLGLVRDTKIDTYKFN